MQSLNSCWLKAKTRHGIVLLLALGEIRSAGANSRIQSATSVVPIIRAALQGSWRYGPSSFEVPSALQAPRMLYTVREQWHPLILNNNPSAGASARARGGRKPPTAALVNGQEGCEESSCLRRKGGWEQDCPTMENRRSA
mmetsp:Transcript_2427/g.3213  ORF Transcript_2427/g.3213 Transcript_2427/m.3213 type:complete len:140 (-) Transcript_2427:64-483(-)